MSSDGHRPASSSRSEGIRAQPRRRGRGEHRRRKRHPPGHSIINKRMATQIPLPGFAPLQPPARSRVVVSDARLPTNTTTRFHRIHRWFNFIAGFSPEFVHQHCEMAALEPGSTLLDPFAGCGTSLVVAAERGLCAVGYDPHPIFNRICGAKLPAPDGARTILRSREILSQGFQQPVSTAVLSDSQSAFLSKLYPLDILESLLGAREWLHASDLADSDLAFLMLSRIVDRCSHSQTDGIYKAPTSKKLLVSPAYACAEIANMMLDDHASLEGVDLQQRGRIIRQSSRTMEQVTSDSVSIIVTSPPYLNNFDFAEMTRMLLYFWGIATSWGDITDKVRHSLIVNTTTALKGQKPLQALYRENVTEVVHQELDRLVVELGNRKQEKKGKKDYDLLIYPYFSQMTDVLREAFRVLRAGAPIHIVVADAALYGIHISTPQLLQACMEEIGFRRVDCDLMRPRGHRWALTKREGSPIGLGEYHVHGVK
jgi:DNA modification methylase